MRVPLSWLREHVDLPAGVTGLALAERLTEAGLKVEGVDVVGADLTGPLVVGRVLSFTEETHTNGKTVRWCQVDTCEGAPRGIVCGARNFATGDLVVVALPGAVLPGDFAISARRTYGHVSDGMICSARELGIGADAAGILVFPAGPAAEAGADAGADAVALLGLRDEVLDIAVTPDRGYALSIRGVARETATAYAVPWRDPADLPIRDGAGDGIGDQHRDAHPVRVEDPTGCPLFVARTVVAVDPSVPSPPELARRLQLAGMRSISLVVDVTNYVMLELGQPIHAYDRDRLQGTIVVRRARAGERLETLDGVVRDLDPQDLLITDSSGPVGVAGVMGGASTEVSGETTSVVVEAAHFDPVTVGRAARRHRLPSEASRRFERGVDRALPAAAAQRVVDLLVRIGGAKAEPGSTVVGRVVPFPPIPLAADLPGRVAGRPIPPAAVRDRLAAVGATTVDGPDGELSVTPPTWRSDLTDPFDLVEEVVRLEGYDTVPSVLPVAPTGRGWTLDQRRRQRVGRALAAAGYVEAPSYPFVAPAVWDQLGLGPEDERRQALRLANPVSDEEPLLRTTLLPGLLAALRRNAARGASDVGLFEEGLVFRPEVPVHRAPRPPVDRRPTAQELAALDAAVPRQPRHVAVVLAGARELPGWWGPGRPGMWADAVEAAREVARVAGAGLTVRRGERTPWHPGRCAELVVDSAVVGHAGELHARAVSALGLPPRTCAMELDLDRVLAAGEVLPPAPRLSAYPAAAQDVALVVAADVPAAEVEAALHAGAGDLLEAVRLFDVYTGGSVGPGRKSLAYALRFRAPDRTLTAEEAGAARDAAVAEAGRRTGAVLRGADGPPHPRG